MNNSIQNHINQITKKNKIKYLDISNRDLNGVADLSEFTALQSLNSYNNKFEDLTFLNSLPNKNQLKKLNFFGNQLKEIDFAWLFTNFPNLEQINCENNPVKTKDLNNLTSEQFSKLITGIKNKKFRVVSWQGTILMDLLEYAQSLVARGNTSHNAHVAHLQELVQKQPEIKSEIQPKITPNNHKNSNFNAFYLVGSLVLFGVAVLAIGYWLGQRKKSAQIDELQEF